MGSFAADLFPASDAAGDIGDDEVHLWVGRRPGEINDVENLATALTEWIEIREDLKAELVQDRIANR